jgi:hypothetical protein
VQPGGLAYVQLNRYHTASLTTFEFDQFEFVNQLSADSGNTVFALVRSKNNANKLTELRRHNVHIIEADITDNKALKVGV